MRNVALLAPIAVLASGCYIDARNGPPSFGDLYAEIFLAQSPVNDRLVLSAEVFDPEGPGDVVSVTVEVYDDYLYDPYYYEYYSGLISEVELVPTGGRFWDADVSLSSAGIDPVYADVYSLDFVVRDRNGIGEVLTVLPVISEPL